MLTKDKITEIFCISDDFCKEFNEEIKKHRLSACCGKKRRNRICTMSDSEIITVLLCFHFGSFRNFKHYYLHYVGEHLKSEFPDQLSYNRFIQLEHRVMIPMMLFLKLVCFGECTGINLSFGYPISSHRLNIYSIDFSSALILKVGKLHIQKMV